MLKRKMNRINIILKRIINSVIFRKILVIFVMGLVSRFVVNGVFDDVNVLKEYTSYILLVYYSIMACFELSIISFNVLDIKLVKDAIKMFCEGGFLNKDKMLSGNQSLDKLCYSFDVEVTKGKFPHSFVKRNTINYIGDTPAINY